jgi:polyhydroxybutyrate depolymerase
LIKRAWSNCGLGVVAVLALLGCSSAGGNLSSSVHGSGSTHVASGSIAMPAASGSGSGSSDSGTMSSGVSTTGAGSGSPDGNASGAPGSGVAESGQASTSTLDATVPDQDGATEAGANDSAVQSGGNTVVPSVGCGVMPTQATAKYVQYNINVTTGLAAQYVSQYTARNYYVYLPTNYDPSRAYTTVFLGPGCGGNGESVLPMQQASTTNAILVGLSPVGQCFMTSAADSPEIAFFDAALSKVESSFCVDKSRVFIAGFSSGSWLSNLIGCARAGIVRGQGNATGGLPPVPTCSGPIAAMLAHDEGDPANNISGGEMARDRILAANGCSLTETTPYDPGTGKASMCVQYMGCPAAYPVVWCPTTGQGHSDQVATGLSVPGFWKFWEALPYVSPPQ